MKIVQNDSRMQSGRHIVLSIDYKRRTTTTFKWQLIAITT